MAPAIALLLPIAAAWLALRATRLAEGRDPLLQLALATCFGIGASSVVTFWWVVAGNELGNGFVTVDALLWMAVAAAAAWRSRAELKFRSCAHTPQCDDDVVASHVPLFVRITFGVLAVVAAATVVQHYLVAPHGHWDAWAIWNQKARFLVRDIAHWKDMQAIGWSNPSHPFLVSLSVARLWAYAGSEATLWPAMLSALWGIALVLLLLGGLGPARWQAWVAGALVMAPVMFTDLAAAQTADLPVALFIAAAVVLASGASPDGPRARGALVAAALLATIAAWTKNEGLLFAAAMTAVIGAWSVWLRRPVAAVWWVAGLIPVGIAVLWFKFVVAPLPPEYLTESADGGTLGRFLAGPRHALVLETAWPLLWSWGGRFAGGLLPLGMAAAVVSAARRPSLRPLTAVLGLMLAGYYAVWVVSALDTAWLVRTTFDRLMMQLWPALVFIALADER